VSVLEKENRSTANKIDAISEVVTETRRPSGVDLAGGTLRAGEDGVKAYIASSYPNLRIDILGRPAMLLAGKRRNRKK
jgi:hypothetical protein